MSGNLIGEKGIQQLMTFLKITNGVVSLDLRQNPGYSREMHKRTQILLRRNIRKLSEDEYQTFIHRGLINRDLFESPLKSEKPVKTRNTKGKMFISQRPITPFPEPNKNQENIEKVPQKLSPDVSSSIF